MKPIWAVFVGMSLVGCVEADETSATTQNINGGDTQYANDWQAARAVMLSANHRSQNEECTATRIGWRWALTALHCTKTGLVAQGTPTYFYKVPYHGEDASPTLTGAVAVPPVPRPGTDADACDDSVGIGQCDDANGDYADLAILELSNAPNSTVDSFDGPSAVMAWNFPGNFSSSDTVGHVAATKVGAGEPGGAANPGGVLYQVDDTITSTSDSGGSFHTDEVLVDHGDSGGPIYVGGQLVGDLHGWVLANATYTSVPHFLPWILSTIQYRWAGAPSIPNIAYAGTLVTALPQLQTEAVCQYACENTSGCDAYSYANTNCSLFTDVTGVHASTGTRSALRWGQSGGRSGQVVGYDRGDNHSVVVHATTAAKINEIMDRVSGPTTASLWQSTPPPVSGAISGYVRNDGSNAVVYRSSGQVIELALEGSWVPHTLDPGPLLIGPTSDPVAYTRADNVNAVVYQSGNSLVEIRHTTAGTIGTLLNANCSGATSPPSAFARSDGFSSVIYIGGGQVRELFKATGGAWTCGSPSLNASAPAANPAIAPFGFTRFDGKNAIVYVATTGHVIELTLGSSWTFSDISGAAPASIGTPIGIVRSDGTDSVFYRTGSSIWEIHKGVVTNLSVTMSLPNAATNPSAFVRLDGVTSVVFTGSDNRITELTRGPLDTAWTSRNLSTAASETP